jgi:hypothetical protein
MKLTDNQMQAQNTSWPKPTRSGYPWSRDPRDDAAQLQLSSMEGAKSLIDHSQSPPFV